MVWARNHISTKECLLDQRCLGKDIIYQATVEQPNKESKTYVGLTATTFKARFGVHKKSFEDPEYNPTTLSKHIHDLKSKGIEPKTTWKILVIPLLLMCVTSAIRKLTTLFLNHTWHNLTKEVSFFQHACTKNLISCSNLREEDLGNPQGPEVSCLLKLWKLVQL